MHIAVLGSTGMLGTGVLDYFHSVDTPVIEISRNSTGVYPNNRHMKFDINRDSVSKLVEGLPDGSFLINASGIIKHKIDSNSLEDLTAAIKVNSVFPHELAEKCSSKKIRIFQIATDCVFSGEQGNYSEADLHDPTDIYGVTKSLGESESHNVMTLRCSMIGLEKDSSHEFLNWVIDQPLNESIQGFENHLWNGLTTLHVAKILRGIIDLGGFREGVHHLLPKDFKSKLELIEIVASEFDRHDLVVEKSKGEKGIDRRLITVDNARNRDYWKWAGYSHPLGISEMISEYKDWTSKLR
jgi:dTDP-4-dehydrorhamnose reductase